MIHRIKLIGCLLLVSLGARAQEVDPEWPCIQVLVPEVVTAVVWPEIIDDSLSGTWREDQAISGLANKLSEADEITDAERRLIANFAESIPEASRTEALNRLADGIVTLTNRRRSKYIDGIKRYTRQQIAISKQIESSLNRLAELESRADSGDAAMKLEIEDTLHWQKRIYDQRERAIQTLCELPVELEERLSEVLRETAQYLP